MSVAEQLAAATTAHKRYRALHGTTRGKDKAGMVAAVAGAKVALEAAEEADPTHADPAWASFEVAMKGQVPGTLLAFYAWYLASPDEKTQMEPPT